MSAVAAGVVAEMTPVAQAALTNRDRADIVNILARQIMRVHDADTAVWIAAEAIVTLAEHQARSLGHIRLAADFPDNQPIPYRIAEGAPDAHR
jgi:hypothetical protein